jgi:hypothetical protein
MSFPFAAAQLPMGPINPLESALLSVNTNPYFIGIFMLLLNLGGKYIQIGITPEQDRFLQQPWIKPLLFFTVLFIATRNIFAAFWLSIALYIILDHLLNEKSQFYLFREKPIAPAGAATAPATKEAMLPTSPFTPEEAEIYNRLQAKQAKYNEDVAALNKKVTGDSTKSLESFYAATMAVIQNGVLGSR